MGEHGDKPNDVDPAVGGDEPGDADPGWVGGGGPATTIEGDEPTDEERHLADTEH